MSDKHKHKHNNDKETLKLLQAMFDGKDAKHQPAACNDAHMLLDAKLVEKELDETNEAAKALIAIRADVTKSDADKADALEDFIKEARELSDVVEDFAKEFNKNPYIPAALSFNTAIEAFIKESKSSPLPANYDADLLAFKVMTDQADDEADALMDRKAIDKLEDETHDAEEAVEAVVAYRAATTAPSADVLKAAYAKANEELGDVVSKAALIAGHLHGSSSDPFVAFIAAVQAAPAAVLADLVQVLSSPSVVPSSFDADLATLLPLLKAQRVAEDRMEDALDFNELLGQCSHDLVKDIAADHHHNN